MTNLVTVTAVTCFLLSLLMTANTKPALQLVDGDPCVGEPCQNGGYCVVESNTTFWCYCPSGWTGPTCGVEEDPCADSPCQNGGTCNPDYDLFYTCTCETGWRGNDCDEPDPCALDKCPESALCLQRGANYVCVCFNDDEEPFFCDKADAADDADDAATGPCASSPCLNGGTCEEEDDDDDPYGYTCTCTDDWTGFKCQESVADPCATAPCENGGTCVADKEEGTYSCNCSEDWSGENCEESEY